MFNYPNGKTVMNSIIWLLGAVEFLFGVLVVVSSFVPALEEFSSIGLDAVMPILGPTFSGAVLTLGIVLIISSFPTLMFAEIHMKSTQTNRITKRIYDRLKS